MKKEYYSIRTGKNKNFSRFDLDIFKKLFSNLYTEFDKKGYFQEYFGYECIDAGSVCGILGENIDAKIFSSLRKDYIWPIKELISQYTEDDLFDVIEFLYDYVSEPIKGRYHEYGMCGWHYSVFDKANGQKEFLGKINEILCEYESGFQMSPEGLILIKDQDGLEDLY